MDPDYLNTVAYVEKPGIGRIYDYRTHHAKNEELAKKKEEKRRAQDIVDAAKKEIAYQSVSSKAFDQWRAQKLLEKEMKSVIKTTITVQRKKQGGKVSEEEMTKIRNEREAKWMGGFGSPATLHKTRVARVSGSKDSQEPIQSEKLWRSEKFY